MTNGSNEILSWQQRLSRYIIQQLSRFFLEESSLIIIIYSLRLVSRYL